MKNRIKEYINVLFDKKFSSIHENGHISKSIVSLVFLFATSIILILNIIAKQELMVKCSIGLIIGFFISFIVAFFFKKNKLSSLIIAILTAIILSIFAYSGGNGGFAILWILLVPIVSVNLLGLQNGIMLSTYFLIFLIIIFLTPLHIYFDSKYTIIFMHRFPILYFCDYVISIYLSIQKEFYYKKMNLKSYVDELTGTYNRRYFMEKLNSKDNNYGIIIIDINGLKVTNDTLGHKAGDELISAVPKCIKSVFDKKVEICRIGGDEFAIFTNANKTLIIKNIKDAKKFGNSYKGQYINSVSFSAGYAIVDDKMNSKDAYQIADKNMYKDKEKYYAKHDRRKR